MAPTLALRFLTLVFLFFTNGQGIGARDLKVEQRDQKQADSNDETYITGYITTQPKYAASYTTTTKHNTNHLSHHGKLITHPYIAGYRTSTGAYEANQPNYISGYRTRTHDSNENYITIYGGAHETNQPNYIAGYRTSTHDSNKPYRTSYGNAHEGNQPNYIAGYRTSTYDSNEPYRTSYGDAHEHNQPNYIAGYRTSTHDSNKPYRTSYGNAHEGNQPNYIAGYRTSTHDSNKPYITSYGDTPEANQPDYIAGPYNTATGTHDSSETPYRAQYKTSDGAHDEANQPNYITGYISTSPDSKRSPFPHMDHTEAFKTGFFTLDDLHVGNVMTLQFPIQEVTPFLSRKEADSIPLSISQLPSVLQLFSIPEDSPQAKSMRGTLEQCEGKPITGETKICVNSLESMLEFVDTIIGTSSESNGNKHEILTTSHPSPSAIPLQKYTILEVSHDIDAPKWVACHPLSYPYAVYYCHFIATGSKVFKVSLVGEENGDKMEALGICHLDTSDWSPDHILFKHLGIKPGKKTPVCHLFPVNHLLWAPQPSKANM